MKVSKNLMQTLFIVLNSKAGISDEVFPPTKKIPLLARDFEVEELLQLIDQIISCHNSIFPETARSFSSSDIGISVINIEQSIIDFIIRLAEVFLEADLSFEHTNKCDVCKVVFAKYLWLFLNSLDMHIKDKEYNKQDWVDFLEELKASKFFILKVKASDDDINTIMRLSNGKKKSLMELSTILNLNAIDVSNLLSDFTEDFDIEKASDAVFQSKIDFWLANHIQNQAINL